LDIPHAHCFSCESLWWPRASRTTFPCSSGKHMRKPPFGAEYVISFARITVGNAIVRADISGNAYAVFASGHAGGAMRLLADGEGNLTSRGSVTGNRLLPSKFMLKIDSPTDPLDVNMAIQDGDVTELTVLPPGNPDSAPITDADRKTILDPLTAMFVPTDETGDGLNKEICRRKLPIFDVDGSWFFRACGVSFFNGKQVRGFNMYHIEVLLLPCRTWWQARST
jgi:hypothetical protein